MFHKNVFHKVIPVTCFMSRRTLALFMTAQDDDIKLQSRDSSSYQFISDTMSNLSFGFGSREISYHER